MHMVWRHLPRLPYRLQNDWLRYGFALAASVLFIALRFALNPLLPDAEGSIIFVPAVALAIFFCGLGPGILAACLTCLAFWYFFLPPYNGSTLDHASIVAIAEYVIVVSTLIVLLQWVKDTVVRLNSTVARLEKAKHDLEEVNKRERLLTQELQHRTKNLFALVHSLATQTLRNAASLPEARQAFIGRLDALSRADQSILDPNLKGSLLHYLVRSELTPFPGRFEVNGPNVIVDEKTSQNVSLVLHELATNAAKYGALSTTSGRVDIAWNLSDANSLAFRWKEFDGPKVRTPTRRGFGTSLLEHALGKATVHYEADGVRYEASIKASPLGSETVHQTETAIEDITVRLN